jgi:hypothetical protein
MQKKQSTQRVQTIELLLKYAQSVTLNYPLQIGHK